MFCGMVTIGGARGLHDRRSGRSVVGLRLLSDYSDLVKSMVIIVIRGILIIMITPYVK